MNLPPEDRFHSNMERFGSILHSKIIYVSEKGVEIINPNLVGMILNFVLKIDKEMVIKQFIYYSYAYWDQIYRQDEIFFLENANKVFINLAKYDKGNVINLFKQLLEAKDKQGNLLITPADRKLIWDYFKSFVKISIRYLHDNNILLQVPMEDRSLKVINISEEAQKWNLVLS